ncbi:uncharacterized protein LOC123550491 [Mercenaria mercenaria]|uniref:uncharacterized protein LOC123550491 n=1 Tax=Mercenaria mercenaria TaxID=6596 RepID=UPI00234F3FA2|nr:uncharacterized protein LOC123550491 [Mercenaria mercenaria]
MDLFVEEKSKDYDLVVKVGADCIRAHKSVLVEHSEYCKALFCGQYRDSLKNELDLSEIARNISEVRAVVSFMYTGDMLVDNENLTDIMKLSSFLSVSSLDKYLVKYLLEALSVKTCLKYYCLCWQYGFKEVERKAGIMLKARFHDCVIKDENSLNFTPDMLKHVFDNSFLKFCSGAGILKFIAKWLERYPDEIGNEIPDKSMVEVSTHILHSLNNTEAQKRPKINIPKLSIEEDLVKIKKLLEKEQKMVKTDEFLDLFRRTMSNLYTEPELPEMSEDKKKSTPVLVTLSLRDMPEGKRYLFEKYVYDLCVYNPETGIWYLLTTFKKKVFKQNAVINLMEDDLTLVHARGKLYLMDGYRRDMATYDYTNRVWYYWEDFISDLVLNDEFEHHSNLYLTTTPSGDMYLVVEVLRWRNDIKEFDDVYELQENNILDGFYFIAARYGKEDETFHEVFRTEMIPVTNKEMEFNIVEMSYCSLKVNKKNEMIFVQTLNRDNNVAVLFDLKEDAPCKTIPFKIEKEYWSLPTCILEDEDKFVVIGEDYRKDEMFVLFECQYGSNDLNFETYHGDISYIHSSEKFKVQNRSTKTVAGKESLWHIEKLLDDVSVCRQVAFKGEPSVVDHTPPPFTSIISAHEMDFPIDVLEKLNPITDLLLYGK